MITPRARCQSKRKPPRCGFNKFSYIIFLVCLFRLFCGQRKIGPPVLERHASTQTKTLHFNVLMTIVETAFFNSRRGIRIDHRNIVCKPPKGFNTCLYSELSLGNQKHSCHHTTSVKCKLDQTPVHPQFSVESALSAYPFNNRHF